MFVVLSYKHVLTLCKTGRRPPDYFLRFITNVPGVRGDVGLRVQTYVGLEKKVLL